MMNFACKLCEKTFFTAQKLKFTFVQFIKIHSQKTVHYENDDQYVESLSLSTIAIAIPACLCFQWVECLLVAIIKAMHFVSTHQGQIQQLD